MASLLVSTSAEASRTSVWSASAAPQASVALARECVASEARSVERALALGNGALDALDEVDDQGLALFTGDELDGPLTERTRSFHLDGAELPVPALVSDAAPSYPKTRVRAFDFLGQEVIGVERGLSLTLRWGSGVFGLELASGSGEWLSEDPAGTVDSPSLYAFVGNRPNLATDPAGTCAFGLPCPEPVQRLIDGAGRVVTNVTTAAGNAAAVTARGVGQALQVPADIVAGAALTVYETGQNVGIVLDHSRPEEERRHANREIGKVVVPLLVPELFAEVAAARFGRAAGTARGSASARSWKDFLPEARRRLETAKAAYGDGPYYAMDGPRPPRSPLGRDVTESFPDPDPLTYRNGLRPDTPVEDHIRARALRGHPTDPENLHTKAWSENARKGWHEGEYLRQREALIRGGLTREQAEWVLEDYLRWIETDVHPTPVDPAKLDRLQSP